MGVINHAVKSCRRLVALFLPDILAGVFVLAVDTHFGIARRVTRVVFQCLRCPAIVSCY